MRMAGEGEDEDEAMGTTTTFHVPMAAVGEELSAPAQLLQDCGGGDASDHTFGGMSGVTVATLENPTVSVGNDDVVGVRSPRSTGCSGLDEHEKDPKRM